MFHHDAQHSGRSSFSGPSAPALKWTFATGNCLDSSPAVGADGTIYVGSEDNNLYALNPADGSLKWNYPTRGAIYSSPAIGADGTIYVGSEDGKLYALNPDGSFKWSYSANGGVGTSPAIGTDGTIYFGSDDWNLYALNPANGSLKWQHAAQAIASTFPRRHSRRTGPFTSAPMTITFYALNPGDGSQKWSYNMGCGTDSSPAVGADGTIYVGCYNAVSMPSIRRMAH